MTRRLSFAVVCMLALPPAAQATPSIHPLLRAMIETDAPTPGPLRGPVVAGSLKQEGPIGVWVRCRDGGRSLQAAGLLPADAPSALRSARWTREQLREAAADPNVTYLAPAVRCFEALDSSMVDCGGWATHAPTGHPPVYHGPTGAGVIVGIVDSGIDYHHDDFLDASGHTRLLAIWDQTVASSNPPRNFNYGYLWTRARIDNGTSSEEDTNGHGTHVSGIAAGDGSATGNGQPAYTYVGMAPESPMIMVKTDYSTSSVADGVKYIFQMADSLNMPAVVNISLGTQFGPHDGTDDFSQELNHLAGRGHSIVAAAGNDMGAGIHAQRAVVAPDTATISFQVPVYTPGAAAQDDEIDLDGWYAAGASMSFLVRTPNGASVGPVALGAHAGTDTPDGYVDIDNSLIGAVNGDREVAFRILDLNAAHYPAPGFWTIVVTGVVTGPAPNGTRFDLWNYFDTMGSVQDSTWFLRGMDETDIVIAPATADSVIAVGAYVTKRNWVAEGGSGWSFPPPQPHGAIAHFSSVGPRRDGVNKPDIAAPGRVIASSLSSQASFSATQIVQDGVHVIEQGTSMASPHVAGAVALMYQNYMSSGPHGVKWTMARITKRSTIDAFTGSVPNPTWGWGKLDVLRATGSLSPATLLQAQASQQGERVLVQFLLSTEAGNGPLPVYRQEPGSDGRTAIGWSSGGQTRSFVDSTLTADGDYAYWLQIAGEGGANWLGPASVHFARPRAASFDLSPNPFVSRTELAWSAAPGTAQITILDLAGRRVRTLAKPAAERSGRVAWDGADARGARLPAGVYLVRFTTADGRSIERKAIKLQ